MRLIVDRLNGAAAVCEDENRKMVEIAVSKLPAGIREGDCLFFEEDGSCRIDQKETHRRRDEAARLMGELFED